MAQQILSMLTPTFRYSAFRIDFKVSYERSRGESCVNNFKLIRFLIPRTPKFCPRI